MHSKNYGKSSQGHRSSSKCGDFMDMLRRLINCRFIIIYHHQNLFISTVHYEAYSHQDKSISDQ